MNRQQHRTIPATRPRGVRRGLAPLELVLSLPMLLLVMAVMVVFGNAAYWKVRGSTVARHAAWSTRWPRSLEEPPPRNWLPGSMLRQDADPLEELDDPALEHPVVRGPITNEFQVREELLDPSRGALEGRAEIKRTPAMVPTLGPIKFDLTHPLLDDKFQYPQMGIPANTFRRIPFIYELPKADASLSQAFLDSIYALLNSPSRSDWQMLDRDEELRAFYGHYRDFHPRMPGFCSLGRQEIWKDEANRLLGRIKGRAGPPRIAGVPDRLTAAFIHMYQSQINDLQSQINDLQDQISQGTAPPGAAQQIASLQAQIASLTQTLQPLLDFRQQLNDREDTPDGPPPF